MTREQVKELVMNVSVYYPNYKIENPTNTVNAWYMMLQDEDCEKVAMALKEYIKTDKTGFAPSIGNLLNRAADSDNVQVDEAVAWAMVVKAMRNSAYDSEAEFEKLPVDVQRAVGSPWQLKEWGLTEKLNMGVESSNFYKRLENARERIKAERILGNYNKNQIGKNETERIESSEKEVW